MRIKDKEGNEIKLTPDHRVLVKDKGWINTKDIVKGDIIININLWSRIYGICLGGQYNENSILDFPKGKIKASDIWNADSYKMKIAKKRNYNYLIIWENEIDNTIDLINERVNIN